MLDIFEPPVVAGPAELTHALAKTGSVARIRNGDLWDALATGVLRQVIRAGQARRLYQRLSTHYGERLETSAGAVRLFPTPEVLSGLSDDEFGNLGLSFKRAALRAAAEAVRDRGHFLVGLAPNDLMDELLSIHRIGPWTAGAVVADVTGDFTFYPYSDLAVRTWARRLAPGMNWPDTEQAFATLWQRLAGDQLSSLTAVTLAQGGVL